MSRIGNRIFDMLCCGKSKDILPPIGVDIIQLQARQRGLDSCFAVAQGSIRSVLTI